MPELLANPETWIALITLIALEIVLGIDNIVFISILVGNLPPQERERARRLGIGLALIMRLCLLFALSWVIGLVTPLVTLFGNEISGRDLILICGGLFLLAKSTHEIHDSLEVIQDDSRNVVHASFGAVIAQIGVIDMVFSLDSVITAIGLVDHIVIMVAAVLVSMLLMLVLARPIGQFVEANPTFKMLALAFLILIGSTLVAEGLDFHVPRGYIYFSMAFSVSIELLNMAARSAKNKKAVKLNRIIRPAAGAMDLYSRR